MATTVTLCGTTYSVPAQDDTTAWGPSLSNFLVALSVQPYYTSQTANPALSGFLRLAKTDSVSWRNNGNTADLALSISAGDALQFAGVALLQTPLSVGYGESAAKSLPAGTLTQLAFGASEFDNSGGAVTTASTAWQFTVPTGKAGRYFIQAGIGLAAATSGAVVQLVLRVNGTTKRILASQVGGASAVQLNGSTTVDLAAGAVVTIWASQASGGAVNTAGSTTTGFVEVAAVQG